MIRVLVLLFLLTSHGWASSRGETVLIQSRFGLEDRSFVPSSGSVEIVAGHALLLDATLVSNRAVDGDLQISIAGSVSENTGDGTARLTVLFASGKGIASFTFGQDGVVSLGLRDTVVDRSFSIPGEGPFNLRLVSRGGSMEAWVGDTPVVSAVSSQPLGGGAVEISGSGCSIQVDSILVERLAWRDSVLIDGADEDRLLALGSLPRSAFMLADPPLPSLIDPAFHLLVEGRDPVVVRCCGVRPDAGTIPLLDQALAQTWIRPYIVVTVREGGQDDAVVRGDGPFGPYRVNREPVSVEVEALAGNHGEWPSLTLFDADAGRILDRVVPGGPMGRNLYAEIPAECSKLRLSLSLPGRKSIDHELVLIRS